MPSYSTKQRLKASSNRKYILGALALLLVIGLLLAFLEKTNRIDLLSSTPSQPGSVSQDNINFDPPTKEDAQAVDKHKEDLVKNQNESGQSTSPEIAIDPATNKKSVKPVIGSISDTHVRSLVPGIIENDGICTAKFTKDGQTISRSAPAFADAQNTICKPIDFTGSGVSAGWKVTVTYESNVSEGTSDASTIR